MLKILKFRKKQHRANKGSSSSSSSSSSDKQLSGAGPRELSSIFREGGGKSSEDVRASTIIEPVLTMTMSEDESLQDDTLVMSEEEEEEYDTEAEEEDDIGMDHQSAKKVLTFTEEQVIANEMNHMRQIWDKEREITDVTAKLENFKRAHQGQMEEKENELTETRKELSRTRREADDTKNQLKKTSTALIQCQHELFELKEKTWNWNLW